MTRVRENHCHGHFPNILLENMLYRYMELVLTEARVGLKKRKVMQRKISKNEHWLLSCSEEELAERSLSSDYVSVTKSTVRSKGVFTTGDAKALVDTLQDMAVHGKSISKPVPIKRLFSQETCKGFNVTQVVNRLIYERDNRGNYTRLNKLKLLLEHWSRMVFNNGKVEIMTIFWQFFIVPVFQFPGMNYSCVIKKLTFC